MTDLDAPNGDQTTIVSFDGTQSVQTRLSRPDRYRHLFTALSAPTVISRGKGLTYCLASAANQGLTVSSDRFNRLLGFDENSNTIRVEPGVDMGTLLEFASSRNLLPPVLPGYPRITVGGAVAMNIHGKNQLHAGNFGDHIRSLMIYHPDRGEIRCSPEMNPDIFQLTIGGFGLTGHITSVELSLKRSPGNNILVRRHAVRNLVESVELMERIASGAEYLYSWHDLNLRGKDFGKGTVYSECHCEGRRGYTNRAGKFRVPLPWPAQNRLTIPLICKLYQAKERRAPRTQIVQLGPAFFPFAGKELFFRLYGRAGFREYQALLPREGWESSSKQIAKAISDSAVPITFGSLKLFRGQRRMLNFSGDGVCVALDTPNLPATHDLFSQLDEITIDSGGIANLAKDGRLSAVAVRRMYGRYYDEFRDAIQRYDSRNRFVSELRRRIDV